MLLVSRTTQLANKFNEEAKELGLRGLPNVAYMTCCMVTTNLMERPFGQIADPDEPESRSLFAERKIDGHFRKWNTNYGATIATVEVVDDGSAADTTAGATAAAEGERVTRLNSDLVPAAFSHFTIDYSERPLSSFVGPSGKRGQCLVCDLQGRRVAHRCLGAAPIPPLNAVSPSVLAPVAAQRFMTTLDAP